MILLPKSDYSGQKLGDNVRATYRKVGQTCPSDCSGLTEGWCYAMHGRVALHAKKSDREELDGDRLYAYIKGLEPGKKMRHHVSGDLFFEDEPDLDYIESMIKGHAERPDIVGWVYTHGWKQLNSQELNKLENLAFNASCDDMEEAREAYRLGWPTVVVVPEDKESCELPELDTRLVVCPAQTHDLTCSECGICMKNDRKCIVGFRIHGSGKKYYEQ